MKEDKKNLYSDVQMLDFACSFSQFPFAPLFCLSCIYVYTQLGTRLIYGQRKEKKYRIA